MGLRDRVPPRAGGAASSYPLKPHGDDLLAGLASRLHPSGRVPDPVRYSHDAAGVIQVESVDGTLTETTYSSHKGGLLPGDYACHLLCFQKNRVRPSSRHRPEITEHPEDTLLTTQIAPQPGGKRPAGLAVSRL